ncbi:hypothetical protein HRbin15_00586 [bacterium HR15]|nr:hypothetical protein HRbin15_00586 [bacterium HR15]
MNQNGPTSDERLWAMLAHLSALLGYVVLLGQYIAPLVIYLVYRERSRFVAFHALQALYFQLALLVLWVIVCIFAFITCGLGAILALVPIVLNLVFVLLAAIHANNGEWYELPIVGAIAKTSV